MALPININDLLKGQVVESDRLEFKEGWNPQEAIQAVCAFANDFHNLGGGYLVIGIAEQDGKPVLPPSGLSQREVEQVQRKLYELGQKMQPHYQARCEPVEFQSKLIIVVWAPGGEVRPYKAPLSIGRKKKEMGYFVRLNSNTVHAKGELEQELMALANRVPFDDRQNMNAAVTDLQPALIEEFLAEIQSDLAQEMRHLSIEETGRRMEIVRGPTEDPRPLNVGLLFFNSEPHKWFPQTQIDVVHMPDGAGGDRIIEKLFKGPLASMLKGALSYLNQQVVTEFIEKRPDQAEANRFYNVPYAALEESLVNAVYHRSYEVREPIEVRITPEEIVILSHPGPDRSIAMDDLRKGRAVARRYRNRRIGEFLKDLELTEGRGTGIPKILRAMTENGSPEPEFQSDPDRTSFLVRLPVRSAPKHSLNVILPKGVRTSKFGKPTITTTPHDARQVETGKAPSRHQVGTKSALSPEQVKVLHKCLIKSPLTDILEVVGRSDRTKFRHQVINPLLEAGYLTMTQPDKPTSSRQAYYTTEAGRDWLAREKEGP